MRSRVTEQGLVIPKYLLVDIDEVEIRREENIILVVPVEGKDPIIALGTQPIASDLTDASINHDRYINDHDR